MVRSRRAWPVGCREQVMDALGYARLQGDSATGEAVGKTLAEE